MLGEWNRVSCDTLTAAKYPTIHYGYKDFCRTSAILPCKSYMHMNNVDARDALLMHRLFTESF